MNKLIIILFALLFGVIKSGAQYSYVFIKDPIVLNQNNCVIFQLDNLDSIQQAKFNSIYSCKMLSNAAINYDSLSKRINDEHQKGVEYLIKKMAPYKMKQLYPFDSYAFQIFPVLDENSNFRLLIFVLVKHKYPEWYLYPIYIRNGLSEYSVWYI